MGKGAAKGSEELVVGVGAAVVLGSVGEGELGAKAFVAGTTVVGEGVGKVAEGVSGSLWFTAPEPLGVGVGVGRGLLVTPNTG